MQRSTQLFGRSMP